MCPPAGHAWKMNKDVLGSCAGNASHPLRTVIKKKKEGDERAFGAWGCILNTMDTEAKAAKN